MANRKDFRPPQEPIFAGEDKDLEFEIRPYTWDDIKERYVERSVEPITGWTLLFTFGAARNDPAALFTKATPSGVEITDADAALCVIHIEDEDTDTLAPGEYAYDLWRTDAGSESCLAYGFIEILDPMRLTT